MYSELFVTTAQSTFNRVTWVCYPQDCSASGDRYAATELATAADFLTKARRHIPGELLNGSLVCATQRAAEAGMQSALVDDQFTFLEPEPDE